MPEKIGKIKTKGTTRFNKIHKRNIFFREKNLKGPDPGMLNPGIHGKIKFVGIIRGLSPSGSIVFYYNIIKPHADVKGL